MRTENNNRDLTNPLISSFLENKAVGQPGMAPMPDEFPEFDSFIIAHRDYLQTEVLLNNREVSKLLLKAKNTTSSANLAYLSGIIATRKQYSAFLMNGVYGCNKVLKGDSRGGNREAEF